MIGLYLVSDLHVCDPSYFYFLIDHLGFDSL